MDELTRRFLAGEIGYPAGTAVPVRTTDGEVVTVPVEQLAAHLRQYGGAIADQAGAAEFHQQAEMARTDPGALGAFGRGFADAVNPLQALADLGSEEAAQGQATAEAALQAPGEAQEALGADRYAGPEGDPSGATQRPFAHGAGFAAGVIGPALLSGGGGAGQGAGRFGRLVQGAASLTPGGGSARVGRAITNMIANRLRGGTARDLTFLEETAARVAGGMSEAQLYRLIDEDAQLSAEGLAADAGLTLFLDAGVPALGRIARGRFRNVLGHAGGLRTHVEDMRAMVAAGDREAALLRYHDLVREHGQAAAQATWREAHRAALVAANEIPDPTLLGQAPLYRRLADQSPLGQGLQAHYPERAIATVGALTTRAENRAVLDVLKFREVQDLLQDARIVQNQSDNLSSKLRNLDDELDAAALAHSDQVVSSGMLAGADLRTAQRIAQRELLDAAAWAYRAGRDGARYGDAARGMLTGTVRAVGSTAINLRAAGGLVRTLVDVRRQALAAGSIEELHRLLNRAKRTIDDMTSVRLEGLPAREAREIRDEAISRLRRVLENDAAWGAPAASYQRAVNEKWYRAINAREQVRRDLYSERSVGGERAREAPDRGRIETWLRSITGSKSLATRQAFGDFAEEVRLLGEEMERRGVPNSLRGRAAEVLDTYRGVEGHARVISLLRETAGTEAGLYGLGAAGGFSGVTAAGAVGGVLGGVPGAAAGVGFAALMRPNQALMLVGTLRNAMARVRRRLELWMNRAVKAAPLRRTSPPPRRIPRSLAALHDPEKREKAYRESTEDLRRLSSDSSELMRRVSAATGPIGQQSPEFQREAILLAARAVDHLVRNLPPAEDPQLPGNTRRPPSRAEQRDHLLRRRAIEDPSTVLEDLAHLRLTAPAAEAFREVYPQLHSQISAALLRRLTALPEGRAAFPFRTQVGTLLGVDTEESLRPEYLAILQARWAQTQQQARSLGMGRRPARSAGRTRLVESYRTTSQGVEAGL